MNKLPAAFQPAPGTAAERAAETGRDDGHHHLACGVLVSARDQRAVPPGLHGQPFCARAREHHPVQPVALALTLEVGKHPLSGVASAEAVYVGDLYSIDVLGARAVGMDAVLVDPGACWGERDCRTAPDVLDAVRLILERRP